MSDARHPAPHRDRAGRGAIAFALLGGPLAWLVQLGGSFAIMTMACFRYGERIARPHLGEVLPLLLSLLCVAVSLASAGVAWRLYRRTRRESEGDHRRLLEVGGGRTRFLALWGLFLAVGSCVTILVGAIALAVVPTCAA